MAKSSEQHSPLEQFEIIPYFELKTGNIDLSFTNSSVAMVLTVMVITIFLTISVNTRSIIPSRIQLISELMYNFIAQLLKDTVGNEGKQFFNNLTVKNIMDINNICGYPIDTRHFIIKKTLLGALTSLSNYAIRDGWIRNDWIKRSISRDDLDYRDVNKFLGLLALEIWYRLFITKEMSPNEKLNF